MEITINAYDLELILRPMRHWPSQYEPDAEECGEIVIAAKRLATALEHVEDQNHEP